MLSSESSSGRNWTVGRTAAASSSYVLIGESASLVFPPQTNSEDNEEMTNNVKRRKVNMLLDQCETVRFPFKKKLVMENLSLTPSDIPVRDLCNTSLGNTLHKLSLSGNRLSVVPDVLVCCLPALKTLDLSQCDLHELPEVWNLPQLRRLNLSHNRLVLFPDEGMLEGMPELQDLNMYGNKVVHIVVPRNPKVLAKLETLNLGYNDLANLPDELDQLKSLRTLKVQNNFLEKVPSRVCAMGIRTIDVSSNPIIQPPIETCERGVCSMKRYYAVLRLEEQAKQRIMGEAKKKLDKQKQKHASKRGKKRFLSASNSLKGTSASAKTVSGLDSSGLKPSSVVGGNSHAKPNVYCQHERNEQTQWKWNKEKREQQEAKREKENKKEAQENKKKSVEHQKRVHEVLESWQRELDENAGQKEVEEKPVEKDKDPKILEEAAPAARENEANQRSSHDGESRFASADIQKYPSSRPCMWSISYQQLMDVNKMASQIEGYETMTMRDVNKHIVEPVCKETGTSYALHLNPNGLMVDAFVTHSWDEPFEAFVESIRIAYLASMEKPNLWICAFALVQGDAKKVA